MLLHSYYLYNQVLPVFIFQELFEELETFQSLCSTMLRIQFRYKIEIRFIFCEKTRSSHEFRAKKTA